MCLYVCVHTCPNLLCSPQCMKRAGPTTQADRLKLDNSCSYLALWLCKMGISIIPTLQTGTCSSERLEDVPKASTAQWQLLLCSLPHCFPGLGTLPAGHRDIGICTEISTLPVPVVLTTPTWAWSAVRI